MTAKHTRRSFIKTTFLAIGLAAASVGMLRLSESREPDTFYCYPEDNVQAIIDAAPDDSTIVLMEGVWTQNLDLGKMKALEIRGNLTLSGIITFPNSATISMTSCAFHGEVGFDA